MPATTTSGWKPGSRRPLPEVGVLPRGGQLSVVAVQDELLQGCGVGAVVGGEGHRELKPLVDAEVGGCRRSARPGPVTCSGGPAGPPRRSGRRSASWRSRRWSSTAGPASCSRPTRPTRPPYPSRLPCPSRRGPRCCRPRPHRHGLARASLVRRGPHRCVVRPVGEHRPDRLVGRPDRGRLGAAQGRRDHRPATRGRGRRGATGFRCGRTSADHPALPYSARA
jgi:hypothetical protein